MSGATIILLVVIGGIVLWGFLTDWTFSGLLPREGARCTPDKNEKDENAKEYVYDTNGVCVLDSCAAEYMPLGNDCVLEPTISDKQTASNMYHGVYYLDRHDVSCDSGALNQFVLKPDSGDVYYDYKCVENIPGFLFGDEEETGQVIRTDIQGNPSISTDLLTDANIGVDCGGSPISRFQLNARGNSVLYKYNCANNLVRRSTCTDKESSGISNIGDSRALLENEVACDGNGVITQFQLAKRTDDEGKYYYKYRCCDLY